MRRKDEEAGTLAFTGVEQVTSRAPGAQDGTLKIRFSPLSMAFLCFTVVSTAPSWAGSLSTALYSGGPTVMVLGFLVVALCSLCGAASLAEMVSIWPTAEGQIAWTENMAPASCASFLVRRLSCPSFFPSFPDLFPLAAVLGGLAVLHRMGCSYDECHIHLRSRSQFFRAQCQQRKLESLMEHVRNQITAYAAACHPSYAPAQWHTALIL